MLNTNKYQNFMGVVFATGISSIIRLLETTDSANDRSYRTTLE
jgi:hypothetical protein